MSKAKKVVVLSCMIALLVATAVLNFVFTSGSIFGGDVVATSNYFTEYKSARTTTNNEQIIQLDSIIANSEAGSDEQNQALQLKTKLTECISQEFMLENIIQGNGYNEVAVSVSMVSDNVRVYVGDDDFDQDDAVAIYTVLAEELGTSPENVFIQPIS